MKHQARPGIRNAYICERCSKEKGSDNRPLPPKRVFVGPDEPTPRCDKHGVMTRQKNEPYFGQSTS